MNKIIKIFKWFLGIIFLFLAVLTVNRMVAGFSMIWLVFALIFFLLFLRCVVPKKGSF